MQDKNNPLDVLARTKVRKQRRLCLNVLSVGSNSKAWPVGSYDMIIRNGNCTIAQQYTVI